MGLQGSNKQSTSESGASVSSTCCTRRAASAAMRSCASRRKSDKMPLLPCMAEGLRTVGREVGANGTPLPPSAWDRPAGGGPGGTGAPGGHAAVVPRWCGLRLRSRGRAASRGLASRCSLPLLVLRDRASRLSLRGGGGGGPGAGGSCPQGTRPLLRVHRKVALIDQTVPCWEEVMQQLLPYGRYCRRPSCDNRDPGVQLPIIQKQ